MSTLTLYHGSKSGIQGDIAPKSRDKCDFGSGFYMGDNRDQSLTLVCGYDNAKIYTVLLETDGLNIITLDANIDWAMFVAYNRGKLEQIKDTDLYKSIAEKSNNIDLIVGNIANDRMFVVLDRFFSGDITDEALIACLNALNIGKQYVALTNKACEKIKILSVDDFTKEDREKFKRLSEENRKSAIYKADEICKSHRRSGKYFDEILSEAK